jgi:hypothetical protein
MWQQKIKKMAIKRTFSFSYTRKPMLMLKEKMASNPCTKLPGKGKQGP